MIGKVTKIQTTRRHIKKSYGFISAEGKDYYFLLADAPGIELGMDVSFEGESNEKGNLAFQVRPIT